MKLIRLIILLGLLNANNSDALFKASAALNAGMFEEALIHAKIAQEEHPKDSNVYKLIALLYEALDKPKKAVQAWEKCLKYSKNNEIKQEAKNHINILTQE